MTRKKHKNYWVEFSEREFTLIEALYCRGVSAREIAKIADTDHKTILKRLRSHNTEILTESQRREMRIKGIEEAVRMLYELGEMHIADIAKLFSTSRSNIKEILLEQSIELRTHKGQVTHAVNETFFDIIDTEAKAYWLGFIYADGHVDDKCLQFGQLKEDRNHLEMLQESLGSDYKLISYSPNSISLCISRVYMARSLRRLGLKSRKSADLPWPPISQELECHFIRGFMDGDGNIHYSPKSKQLSFSLYSNCEPFLEKIQQILIRECQAGHIKIYKRPDREIGSVLRYGGRRQVKRILDYLYKDATIWLPRKRDKIEPYL